MAEVGENIQGDDILSASAAIEALLSGQQAEEQPKEEIQPQPEPAEAAPVIEASTDEVAQAPVIENTASAVIEQPKAQPSVSPEMELRLSEAEKVAKEAATVRDQSLNTLNILVPQLVASIKGRFPDINTDEDLARVGQTDPARYNEFVLEMGKLQRGQTAQRQAQEAVARETQANEQKRHAEEIGKLQKAIPDFADPEKGRALEAKLLKFAASEGVTPKPGWGAAEVQLLHKAMVASEKSSQEAAALKAAQAKAAQAPPVQKPGVTKASSSKEQKVEEDFARLKRSGRTDDAAAVFRNFLN